MTGAAEALQVSESEFVIDEFLASEQKKDLLRFSTAGSVDDGKSTLIGRLLYDSRNVYEDQIRFVTATQVGQTRPTIDFAQLTDGLRAEREQGITIDVAYRYFSTQRRKFIIADTPGHEQYTRNMATGASTADLAIILIDARKGILTQSRRHTYIASLLGIRHIVAAVNKMDLVDFSQDVYNRIENDFRNLVRSLGKASLVTIPVSALDGDNVVAPSQRMPWYSGPTLLKHLEEVPVWTEEKDLGFRLPIQKVIRPNQYYRGFAGQISSGTVRVGDKIVALPSGRTSRVASITTFDGDLLQASAPQSIALTLDDELDISRGDVIADALHRPQNATSIEASLVWFDGHRLETHKPYLLKHGTQTLSARVTRVLHRTNIQTLEGEAVNSLGMNDIGSVEVDVVRALFFDPYDQNRASGNFILIDLKSNATVAAGMIRGGLETDAQVTTPRHKPGILGIPDSVQAELVEQRLLSEGCLVVRTRVQSGQFWHVLHSVGAIVILEGTSTEQAKHAMGSVSLANINFIALDSDGPSLDLALVNAFVEQLRDIGMLPAREDSKL